MSKQTRNKLMRKFRLPDGARFLCLYDGETETWKATLMIPPSKAAAGDTLEWTATGPGVHSLIMRLGNLWYKSQLKDVPKEVKQPTLTRPSERGKKNEP